MNQFKKVDVEGTQLYLNKSKIFGWSVVYPVKNEDGSINWKHLIAGRTWWNLALIAMFILIFLAAGYEYNQNFQACKEAMEWFNLNQEVTLPDNPFADSLRLSQNYSNMLEGLNISR